jgi:membrane fusion protein (multidrug efflux system)/multidrug efflux system membrane fusion protein
MLVHGGCSGGATGAPERVAANPPGATVPARVPRVATQRAALRNVTYTIGAIGTLESQEEIRITASVEGVVTAVRFREGDAVTRSTVLATIDPERFRMQAERARANMDKMQAQHAQALSDLRRREELLRHVPPLVSDEEVERARQEGERMRASVAEARALYELAELDQQRSIVRPLVAGTVNSKTVATGQHVEAKDVMATLVDTSALNLRFKVSEQESVRLRDGLTVAFTTATRPGREFAARVFHVSSTADPATRMVECVARVGNASGELKPGFFAEVKADVESRNNVVAIPERAVLSTDRGFVVFEVVGGKAVERRVDLGLRTKDGAVEIASGVRPDAEIVTDGGDILRDGVDVQVVAPETRP